MISFNFFWFFSTLPCSNLHTSSNKIYDVEKIRTYSWLIAVSSSSFKMWFLYKIWCFFLPTQLILTPFFSLFFIGSFVYKSSHRRLFNEVLYHGYFNWSSILRDWVMLRVKLQVLIFNFSSWILCCSTGSLLRLEWTYTCLLLPLWDKAKSLPGRIVNRF